MSNIKAILFNKNYFTLHETLRYLMSHGYIILKPIHEIKNFYRVKIKETNKKSKNIREGIKYIF